MSKFLDATEQDWTDPRYEELRDLLVRCAGREGQVTLYQLADRAGIVPGTFPDHDNVRTTAEELIKVMGLQGNLRPLVEAASNLPTVYADQLRAFLDAPARAGTPAPPVPPRQDPDAPPVPRDVPTAAVRDLLTAGFDAEGLRRLIFYAADPTLQALGSELPPRDGLADTVAAVIAYCQRQDILPELLAEVQKANPRRYDRWEAQL